MHRQKPVGDRGMLAGADHLWDSSDIRACDSGRAAAVLQDRMARWHQAWGSIRVVEAASGGGLILVFDTRYGESPLGESVMSDDGRRSRVGRRAEKDRRSGLDTRSDDEKRLIGERRSGVVRRSGSDRRSE